MTPSGPGADGDHSAPRLKGGGTGHWEEALVRPGRLCTQAGEGIRG